MTQCVGFLAEGEDEHNLRHITTCSANTCGEFYYENIPKALEHIAIGHQEILVVIMVL